jgi:hypothetical protein
MNRESKIWKLFWLCIALLAGISLGCFYFAEPDFVFRRSGTFVIVRNDSKNLITDLSINFAGGEIKSSHMNKEQEQCFIANIQGESNLAVKFRAEDGRYFSKKFDIYLDPTYRGKVVLSIESANEIRLINKDL